MLHSFSMTCYVLGAGASLHAGYPLCSSLWSSMVAWLTTVVLPQSEYLEAIQAVDSQFGPVEDVERMFTDLDLGQGAFRGFSEDRRDALKGRIRRCLRNFFMSIRQQDHPSMMYADLAKRIAPGDALITFNYDLALENELAHAKRFRVRNGYGGGFVADWDEPPSDVTVLKLHGSINWIGSAFGGAGDGHYGTFSNSLGARPFVDNIDGALSDYPNRVLDSTFPGGGVVDGSATLILPTYQNQFFVKTSAGEEWAAFYSSLWIQAGEFLSKSDRIVVIGYSLPAADRQAAELLLSDRNHGADLFLCCASSNEGLAARFRECGFLYVQEVGTFKDWLDRL